MKRLIGALSVAGVLFVAGCSEATNQPAPADAGGAGSAATAAGSSASVPAATVGKPSTFGSGDTAGQVTIHSMKWESKAKSEYAPKPQNGAYLVLDVTVESTKGAVSGNPLWFHGIDADGRDYDGLSGMGAGFDPSIDSSDIAQGKKKRGYVVIDMPKKAGTLEYQTPLGDTLVEWKLPAK